MSDSSEKMEPPADASWATFDQPGWKPRPTERSFVEKYDDPELMDTELKPRNPFRSTTGWQPPVRLPRDPQIGEFGTHTARHRVDPMRPANPHTADPQLESYYEERIREGRTGPNWAVGAVIVVLALFFFAVFVWLITLNVGLH